MLKNILKSNKFFKSLILFFRSKKFLLFKFLNIYYHFYFLKKIKEKPIVVVIPSYNNAQWYKKNLDSVFNQQYNNYRIIYIDDFSCDNTSDLVEDYCVQKKQIHKVNLIKNNSRKGASANRYFGSHLCNGNEIVLLLDGDDWLAHHFVFQIINKTYSENDIWLTYGQFIRWPNAELGQCKYLSDDFNFRKMDKWYTSALRTYYAWLFKKIKKEDLLEDNNFYAVAGDVAEMLPMLEMARGHIKFINQILYVYNVQTPFNDFKINQIKQLETTKKIMSKKPYEALKFL